MLKIPLVGYVLRTIGYLPANGKVMSKALEKKESVGVVLDGIAGMYARRQSSTRVLHTQKKVPNPCQTCIPAARTRAVSRRGRRYYHHARITARTPDRFQSDETVEKGWVLQRKAIVAIALKAGVPLVPVYGFGHSSLCNGRV